jgi:preprotein translocase subunit SecF
MEGIRKSLNKTIDRIVSYYLDNYKKMVFIPIVFIAVFAGVIGYHYYTTGQIINEDISLAGGISVSINTNQSLPVSLINSNLSAAVGSSVSVTVLHAQFSNVVSGYTITAGKNVNATQLTKAISALFSMKLTSTNSNVNYVSSQIAQGALYDSLILLGVAFLLVAAVSLFYFRNISQAFSNVISIISDVINVIGVMNLLGISFSTASIAGILMIMGYSADRNIILATNILKRSEASMKYRLIHTIKTSLTMDAAAFVTFIVLFFGTTNAIIQNIAIILIFGVLFDDFTVWILNGSIQLTGLKYKNEETTQKTNL